ncbi:nucleotidyl transferase AbiEii/AbiGii toxin family protein [Pseudomonas sp. SDO5532_S415]
MLVSYFRLPANDQKEILNTAASNTGKNAEVVEKDIWVCFVLEHLFSMPNAKPMAFKGGTSLSKVYKAITRFSEDIDVTIDYRAFEPDLTLEALQNLSNRKREEQSEALKAAVQVYMTEVVKPHLEAKAAEHVGGEEACVVDVYEKGEIRFRYPSRVKTGSAESDYMRGDVLIEFGGRNLINPNELHAVTPDLAADFPNVLFPTAQVTVLAGERTFWEKVTLVHAECNRDFPKDRNRLSRHWYDLAKLALHPCGRNAVADLDLLRDVVMLKQVFYHSGYAKYEKCISGELNLMPEGRNLELLHDDYRQMKESGMLHGEFVPMEEILPVLASLQNQINAAFNSVQ